MSFSAAALVPQRLDATQFIDRNRDYSDLPFTSEEIDAFEAQYNTIIIRASPGDDFKNYFRGSYRNAVATTVTVSGLPNVENLLREAQRRVHNEVLAQAKDIKRRNMWATRDAIDAQTEGHGDFELWDKIRTYYSGWSLWNYVQLGEVFPALVSAARLPLSENTDAPLTPESPLLIPKKVREPSLEIKLEPEPAIDLTTPRTRNTNARQPRHRVAKPLRQPRVIGSRRKSARLAEKKAGADE